MCLRRILSWNLIFSKWQACGNDFVLVNAFNNEDIGEIIANAENL